MQMRDLYEVLRVKEQEYKRLAKEIEALRITASLLAEEKGEAAAESAKQIELRRGRKIFEFFSFPSVSIGLADVAFGGELAFLEIAKDFFGTVQDGQQPHLGGRGHPLALAGDRLARLVRSRAGVYL